MTSILVGDCRVLMADMSEASVDACVTDPPYGLSFMGKRWDYDVPSVEMWREVYRVLKPGARLLAFAGTRTMHRMWCNIEDAGFTIEDSIAWMYGSGFPKHRSKLKPAYEPICVARKGPVSELNIDDCRIGTEAITQHGRSDGPNRSMSGRNYAEAAGREWVGRWPANVMLGCACEVEHEPGCAVRLLDEQSGERQAGRFPSNTGGIGTASGIYGKAAGRNQQEREMDSGGASRFFYVAKASRAERNAGLEGMEKHSGGSTAKGFTADVERGQDRNRPTENHHPTVKPVELMRHLVRLVTPTDGVVLDPFAGSGTTGVACVAENRRFIGIEMNEDYAEIAQRRIQNALGPLFGAA